ncbi:MAG: hypothetical protein ACOYOF_14795 [Verrucomicrobiaceae bacterium]
MIDGAATGTPNSNIARRFEGNLANDQTWDKLSLAARVTSTHVFISWKRGDERPTIEVRRAGK